jgi:hypothetical protein
LLALPGFENIEFEPGPLSGIARPADPT